MHAVMTLVAATAVSIGAGWQKLPTGGYEYIIQIEPEAVNSLMAGEQFTSQIPPEVRDVRSYRILVGRGQLPRDAPPPPEIPLGPPPTDPTLNLGPPPAVSSNDAAPTTESPALQPGEGGDVTPAGGASPHVGIHSDDAAAAAAAARQTAYGSGQPPEGAHLPKGEGTDPSAMLPKDPPEAKTASAAMWPPLFGSLLALFASVGGNVFLGWTAVNMRGRYKALLAHQQIA